MTDRQVGDLGSLMAFVGIALLLAVVFWSLKDLDRRVVDIENQYPGSGVVAETNVTLARLLDEQMTLNKAKLTELEAVIDAMLHQTPRAADSLRMALLK